MSEGRRPDYRIKALNKITDERDYIGAGWRNDDGSIGLRFNRFCTVPVGSDFVISLFPVEDDYEERPVRRRGSRRR